MTAEYRLEVVDYDPVWPEVFEQLRARLEPALVGIDHRIEHVGSTSIPGLAAKPIIDIAVVLAREADVPVGIKAIVGLGYIHKGTRGVPGRESFNLPEGLPAHHLYLVVVGSQPYLDHILLRDLLRRDPVCAAGDVTEKRCHSHLLPRNRAGYTDAKSAFIEKLLARARQEAGIPTVEDPVFDGVTYRWRAQLEHEDVASLIAAAFGSPPVVGWFLRIRPIALGWVSAHDGKRLVGFVNVAWDGGEHASIFDTAVSEARWVFWRLGGLDFRPLSGAAAGSHDDPSAGLLGGREGGIGGWRLKARL